MTDKLGRFFGLDRALLGHGLRLALAAWLALGIAAGLHIQNPYWAGMPVWVVTQATRGLLVERGVFRILGTLIGALAGFVLMRTIADAWLLFALLGAWVALAAALTQTLRGVRAYGALMAGMTAAIVVLPALGEPARAGALALARVECTLIGVFAVTAVTGLFTPDSARAAFYRRARGLAADAVGFAGAMAGGATLEAQAARERLVLAEIAEVESSAALISAGSIEGYRRLHAVTALVVAALAAMAAGRALRGLGLRGGTLPADVPGGLAALARQVRAGAPVSAEVALPPAWGGAEAPPPLARLADALARLVAAASVLGTESGAADARSFAARAVYLPPHGDWRQAGRTGLLAGGATFLAAALGAVSGWPAAELMALGVCIFSMVLSFQPVPEAAASRLLGGIAAGIAVALPYRFLVQPVAVGFWPLMVSIVPVLLVGGLARASRRTAIPAIDFNMGFLLAGQVGMGAAGAAAILSGGAALGLAALGVSLGFMLVPHPPRRRAAAAAAAIRRDLARLIAAPDATAPERWHPRTARQILRLTLSLSRAGGLETALPEGILAALSLGHAIGDLHAAATDPARAALTRLADFATDPIGVAGDLQSLARGVADHATRAAIEDAAGALAAGAALFRFGVGG